MNFIWIILPVVALLVVFGLWQGAARTKARRSWALARDWVFVAKKDYGFCGRHRFQALRRGYDQFAYNRASGSERRVRVNVFDFRYTTSNHSNERNKETHHHFSAVFCRATALGIQPLYIRPEGLLDRVAENLGFNDIDFESAAFSRAFHVKAPDKSWAYQVLTPDILQKLMGYQELSYEFSSEGVLVYSDSLWDNAEVERVMSIGVDLYQQAVATLPKESG